MEGLEEIRNTRNEFWGKNQDILLFYLLDSERRRYNYLEKNKMLQLIHL